MRLGVFDNLKKIIKGDNNLSEAKKDVKIKALENLWLNYNFDNLDDNNSFKKLKHTF